MTYLEPALETVRGDLNGSLPKWLCCTVAVGMEASLVGFYEKRRTEYEFNISCLHDWKYVGSNNLFNVGRKRNEERCFLKTGHSKEQISLWYFYTYSVLVDSPCSPVPHHFHIPSFHFDDTCVLSALLAALPVVFPSHSSLSSSMTCTQNVLRNMHICKNPKLHSFKSLKCGIEK